MNMRIIILTFAALIAAGCGSEVPSNKNVNVANTNSRSAPAVPEYTIEVINTYPHDPSAFTQGLVYHDGYLLEGTGGQQTATKDDPFFSSLRKVEIATGKVLQKHSLDPKYFGEGIALLNGKIYQLTWREGTAFVYDLDGLKPVGEFRYSGQGWGLTEDGTDLYMTDSTHVIRVIDPATFQTKRTIVVNDEKGRPLMELNELEWVKGEIWANVWQKDVIVRIDPATGKLLGRIDLSSITEAEQKSNRNADVLNGIAYDEAGDRLFVTGKLWRKLFEIKVKPKN